MKTVAATPLCTVMVEIVRRLRRINAETQRFAEERRERGKKKLFSSAFLRALCVKADLISDRGQNRMALG